MSKLATTGKFCRRYGLVLAWCFVMVSLHLALFDRQLDAKLTVTIAYIAHFMAQITTYALVPALFAFTVYSIHPRYDQHRNIHYTSLCVLAGLVMLCWSTAKIARLQTYTVVSQVSSGQSVWYVGIPTSNRNWVLYGLPSYQMPYVVPRSQPAGIQPHQD